MEELKAFLDENYRSIAITGLAISAVSFGAILYRRRQRERRPPKLFTPDTVILHQLGRGPHAPSLTPFAVKLETYLRMAKIPYENVHSFVPSSKGKFPWIEYNGESIADSAFAIQHLNKMRGIDFNKNLSPAQRGTARAFQKMCEEHLYWCLVLFRWIYGTYDAQSLFKKANINRFFKWMLSRKVRDAAWYQGLGRHSESEVLQIAKDDLQALTDFLGDKKFMFGDEPCETDCAIFGQLSQIMWQFGGTPLSKMLYQDFPKLVRYSNTMKETFWPDWAQCITCGEPEDPTA